MICFLLSHFLLECRNIFFSSFTKKLHLIYYFQFSNIIKKTTVTDIFFNFKQESHNNITFFIVCIRENVTHLYFSKH